MRAGGPGTEVLHGQREKSLLHSGAKGSPRSGVVQWGLLSEREQIQGANECHTSGSTPNSTPRAHLVQKSLKR